MTAPPLASDATDVSDLAALRTCRVEGARRIARVLRLAGAVLAATVVAGVTACSEDTATPSEEAAPYLTVEQPQGDAVFGAPTDRVVAATVSDVDLALFVGVLPVGAVGSSTTSDTITPYPWQKPAWDTARSPDPQRRVFAIVDQADATAPELATPSESSSTSSSTPSGTSSSAPDAPGGGPALARDIDPAAVHQLVPGAILSLGEPLGPRQATALSALAPTVTAPEDGIEPFRQRARLVGRIVGESSVADSLALAEGLLNAVPVPTGGPLTVVLPGAASPNDRSAPVLVLGSSDWRAEPLDSTSTSLADEKTTSTTVRELRSRRGPVLVLGTEGEDVTAAWTRWAAGRSHREGYGIAAVVDEVDDVPGAGLAALEAGSPASWLWLLDRLAAAERSAAGDS